MSLSNENGPPGNESSATGVESGESSLGPVIRLGPAISCVGWVLLLIGVFAFFLGFTSGAPAFAIPMSLHGMISGLLLVGAGRITTATVETARLTELLVQEMRAARR